MIARNELRGAIALFNTPDRRAFDDDDVALANDLARRAALALDNARLYRKAQSAIEARDDVLAVVSHDLGNPLSAIRIGTTLLLSGLSEEERQTGGWKHIVGIRNSAEQMERLIRDLLEVKRIEAGQLSVERDKVPVRPLVDEAIELLSGIAEAKSVMLSAKVPDGLPALYADRERILQTFSNLVGNAVKFTPEGGSVTIEAAADGEMVAFVVADTGSGISPDDLEHVFDRYWQAKSRRRGRQGIGLGLVIVKGIVEAHHGKVWVESTLGAGSRFAFSLPTWSDKYELLED
jgi:signal transduction histidine kinase